MGLQALDERLAIHPVLLGFSLIETGDLALAFSHYLLDEQLRLALGAFDQQEDKGLGVLDHRITDNLARALACPKDGGASMPNH